GGAACRGAQQIHDEFDRAGAGPQMLEGHRHTVWMRTVSSAVKVRSRRPAVRSAQHDAVAGMPDPKLARPQAVVAEQEVPHRMWLPRLGAAAAEGAGSVHPTAVAARPGRP